MINFLEPDIDYEELDSIKSVFESKWIGKGKCVNELEALFASKISVSSDNVVTTNSCTQAIYLSMQIFDISAQDEIIVPTISFIAVPNAVSSFGRLVLCDVERGALQASARLIEERITKKTKAIFITHYGGFSCEMDEICDLCERYGLILLEDAAGSMFTKYKGKSVGTLGDMGMWSLDAMKLITAGDGGVMYFKDKKKASLARRLCYLGITKESGLSSAKSNSSEWWDFDIETPSGRSIMNDISASIAISQIVNKLDFLVRRRNEIVNLYDNLLSKVKSINILKSSSDSLVVPYFYTIQYKNKNELARHLLENKVYTTFRYYPIHKIPYFASSINFKNADYASEHSLNLPLHSNLSDINVEHICSLIKDFV